MKAIQITFDEELLARLDETAEVKEVGRSEVFRRAVREYLHRRRKHEIAEGYRAAYGDDAGLGAEFRTWEHQGQWPDD